MSETVITGSINIWRDFMRQMIPKEENEGNEEERRLVEAEIEHQAAEEQAEAERMGRAPDEKEHQEGEQIEIMVHGFEYNDEDEDNGYGYERADEEFARRHHGQDDVIDEVIAISELESNLNERDR
jgi:hypothetical protein